MPPAGSQPLFASRKEAGRLLAGKVASRRYLQPAVLALPGAGVLVAYEVARSLQAPLDVVVLCGREHRLDSPACACSRADGRPADPEPPGASQTELAREQRAELAEIRRRELLYRGGRPGLAVAGLTSILVDDGSASAATLRVAVRRLRHARPRRVVLALPLVERETARELGAEADETIHLFELATGGTRRPYGDRGSPSDEDVAALLERAVLGAQR